jgi:GDPmannose 4,6-dehydratase
MSNKAFITGVTGQDGSYLAKQLIEKGYVVHGLRRRASSFNSERIQNLVSDTNIFNKRFFLHYGDLTDATGLARVINEIKPDEVYNLAAQSHVGVSFDSPEYTANVDALGVLRLLETIRQSGIRTRFYQASSSEMFGNSPAPQNELTQFAPQSPYATSKLFGYWITKNYRDAYAMFASNGILFNHESPFRGETFVTKKIVTSLVRRVSGLQEILTLGNLYSVRDWGHAQEYTEIMWRILQLECPTDIVVATGRSSTVKDFVNLVGESVGLKLEWVGVGLEERALDKKGDVVVQIDPGYFRPLEVNELRGDISYLSTTLGFVPSISLEHLVREMVEIEFIRINKKGG